MNLTIYLGEGGDLSAHLFGKGMPLICPYIWQGVANYLPIYLGGHGHASTHAFGKGCPLICEGMAINLPTHLGGLLFIYAFILERVAVQLATLQTPPHLPIYLGGMATFLPIYLGGVATFLPIDLGGDGHLSAHRLLLPRVCHFCNHLFGKAGSCIWVGVAIRLAIDLKRN